MAKSRIKFAKRQAATKVKDIETVISCDHCGKRFGITYVRTMGSAVCAEGNGCKTRHGNGRWEFYCSVECMQA